MNLNMSMCHARCYDGASNMKKAVKGIKSYRASFDQFWAFVEIARQSLDEPTLPRQRKRPRHYKDGDAEAYHPAEPLPTNILPSNRFSNFNNQ